MSQLTFLDKLQVLGNLLISSPIIIGVFVFSLFLMLLLLFYSKLNKKLIKLFFVLIYIGIIGFAIFKYSSYFATSVDSFVTLFMANIYFPMLPVYVGIMLISFIIMMITLNIKKGYKFIKVINIVFFTLIQMLFAVFLCVIEMNKIDLSTNTNIYTNEQTLALLEFGMGLFVVWIVVLLISLYLKKADKIFRSKNIEEHDDFDEYINDYNVPNAIKKENVQKIEKKKKKKVKKNSDVSVVKPETSNVNSNSFNVGLVQSLVPEVQLEEEILSFDDFSEPVNEVNNISDSSISNTNNVDVFSNFEFLNTSFDRKNNDVETIDFDD